MKKKFKFSLELNKETITELTRSHQKNVFGGESTECPEDTAPTRTCDCYEPPTNDRCHSFFPPMDGCTIYTFPTNCPIGTGASNNAC